MAYSVQMQIEMGNRPVVSPENPRAFSHHVRQSRSAESLLCNENEDCQEALYANLYDVNPNNQLLTRDSEGNFYEATEFSRMTKERMSDNTFDRQALTQLRLTRNQGGRYSQRTLGNGQGPNNFLPQLPARNNAQVAKVKKGNTK